MISQQLRIARQRELMAKLEREGHPKALADARRLLAEMQRLLAQMEADYVRAQRAGDGRRAWQRLRKTPPM
jgi:hypothetical protein